MAEEYTGVKFKPKLTSKTIKDSSIREIIAAGRQLGDEGMIFANEGNISARSKKGFLITAAGEGLDTLQKEDFAVVTGCDLKKRIVLADGKKNPSSESIMHHLIYTTNPEAKAVVHAHSGVFLNESKIASKGLLSTDVFLEYGTIELAYNVMKTIGRSSFLIIKGHGAVAVGESVEDAANILINTYRELKGLPVRVLDEPEAAVKPVETTESPEPAVSDAEELKEESAEPAEPVQGGMPDDFFNNVKSDEEIVNPWGGEVIDKAEEPESSIPESVPLSSKSVHSESGYQDAPGKFSRPSVYSRLSRLKSRLPCFKTGQACSACGAKRKLVDKSCTNCGFFYGFSKGFSNTSNFIKIERGKG